MLASSVIFVENLTSLPMKYLPLLLLLGLIALGSCKSVYYKTDGVTRTYTTDTTITYHGASYYYPDSSVVKTQ